MGATKDKSDLIKLGKRICQLRTAQNLSYRKMAQRCGVDYRDIKRYELGATNISVLTLIELAAGLGVEPRELLNFESLTEQDQLEDGANRP